MRRQDVRRESFKRWLQRQEGEQVIGQVHHRERCPIANWLREKWHTTHVAVDDEQILMDTPQETIDLSPPPAWVTRYVLSLDQDYDEMGRCEVTAEEALAHYHKLFEKGA